MKREYWIFLGGVAAGVIGTAIYNKNRQRIKPMAAELVAKAMNLKDKALDYAAATKEHAEDIVAEARHINETKTTEN